MNYKKDFRSKAEKFWDRAASRYDEEERKDEKIRLSIVEKLKTSLKSDYKVLDYACGTGYFSNGISSWVKQVHSVDISLKMLDIAKTKSQKLNIQNIEYEQATIFDDCLELGSYDVILALYVLHLVESPKVIERMHGLLKPGGILIAVTPCLGENIFLSALFSTMGKLGVIPRVTSFKAVDLGNLFVSGDFKLIENNCLFETSNQYFSLCKK